MASPANVALVTGASGFLGKVVVEELIRQRQHLSLKSVILLIRPKNGKTAHDRFQETIASSPCFRLLPDGWTEDVEVFESDLSMPHCGLPENAYERIADTATHIIHAAGCVKFDSEVTEAIASNVDSILHLLELARLCRKLRGMATTSTAYVSAPGAPAHAKLVPLQRSASTLYEALKNKKMTKEEALGLTGHPNVYTLSKSLAEHLVVEHQGNLPVTIVRPSIISAALRYPEPGWIDSKVAFAGLVLCFEKRILKVINGQGDAKLDIIPVDEVASCLIREAFEPATRVSTDRPQARITFSVATSRNSLSINEICQVLQAFFSSKDLNAKRRQIHFVGHGWRFKWFEALYHRGPLGLYSVKWNMQGESELGNKCKRALKIVKAMNAAFGHYTRQTYDFQSGGPVMRFEAEEYVKIVCAGVSLVIPQNDFLAQFFTSNWIEINNLFERTKVRQYGLNATPLYLLADKGLGNLIRGQTKKEPLAHVPGERYEYPLFAALANGHQDAVAALLDLTSTTHDGVDITEGLTYRKDFTDYKDRTPLSWAAQEGRLAIVRILIQRGASLDEADRKGHTPLLRAIKSGDEVVARLLIDKGADVNAKDSDGSTALIWALKKGHEAIARLLIDKGADVNAKGSDGSTALTEALKGGHEAVARLLIDEGADVNTKGRLGSIALIGASQNGHEAVARLLIDKGADVNAESGGSTALILALEKGHEVITWLLIDKGADVNAKDSDGSTPLRET